MKYESSILKRLIDTYGVIGNPRYLSEIIKQFIVRGKERFPELFTYQSDWLAHIDEFGLTPEYTVSYTGQHIYAPNTKEKPVKSAILKGSTKYRDIDTGEFLETFEEGRNLELVSVKMPVLTTVGKNLFDKSLLVNKDIEIEVNGHIGYKPIQTSNVNDSLLRSDGFRLKNGIFKKNTQYTLSCTFISDEKKHRLFTFKYIDGETGYLYQETNDRLYYTSKKDKTLETIAIVSRDFNGDNIAICDVQLEESTVLTTYEPYKTNILTVNEDVTLRSNGNICDELNLLTGQLTQRIDEDGEVLSQEVIKTVDLTIHDKDHQKVERLTSFEGGTYFTTSSQDGSLLPTLTVDVLTDLEETLMVCSLEGNTM